MQSVRQSLLTICICLYAFLAVTLGLSFLVGQADGSVVSGFYHPELSFSFEEIDTSFGMDQSTEPDSPSLRLVEEKDVSLTKR
ncbi:MAG TPA: hypothetical protein V6D07_10305 [Trichocoleus sp.]